MQFLQISISLANMAHFDHAGQCSVVMTSVMTSHDYLDLVMTDWSKSCSSDVHGGHLV